jgi:hypothetical protein
MFLHLRCYALRVARKKITTIKQVFHQPLEELVLLLYVSPEHHSLLQVAVNDEDMDSVLCRLSVTNGQMFVRGVIYKYVVLLKSYKNYNSITTQACYNLIQRGQRI